MPPHRHNLILDEQAFQGLLAAAFIIQEYSDRENNHRLKYEWLKWARQQMAVPDVPPAPESASVCWQCGAPKPAEESQCKICGRDEFRPGERLQRNWASMWTISQEKDQWSVRAPAIRESAQKDVPPPESDFGQRSLDDPSFEASTVDKATFHNPALDDQALGTTAPDVQALNQMEAEGKSTTAAIDEAMDEMTNHPTQEGFTHEDSDLAVPTFQLSTSDDSLPIEPSTDESAEPTADHGAGDSGNGSFIQRLADLRVRLRFNRSNLYLVAAICVAALALFWPAAGSPRRAAALSPWERALVTLGLAEAPEPAVHLQGDPAIEVWIDPHTALYYCPGEEQYGKTADGRFSSQREAQMDRFEPAGRSTCE